MHLDFSFQGKVVQIKIRHRNYELEHLGMKYLRCRGVFLNNRYMDNLILNRMNSRQEIVKKKLETINEISIGSLHNFKFF